MYTAEKLVPKGILQVKVDGRSVVLPLYMIEGMYPPLFGRTGLEKLWIGLISRRSWKQLEIFKKFWTDTAKFLKKNLDRWSMCQFKITFESDSQWKYWKPKIVPYILKLLMVADLDCILWILESYPRFYMVIGVHPLYQWSRRMAVWICRPLIQFYMQMSIHYLILKICLLYLMEDSFSVHLDLVNAYLEMEIHWASYKCLSVNTQIYFIIKDCLLVSHWHLPCSRKPWMRSWRDWTEFIAIWRTSLSQERIKRIIFGIRMLSCNVRKTIDLRIHQDRWIFQTFSWIPWMCSSCLGHMEITREREGSFWSTSTRELVTFLGLLDY